MSTYKEPILWIQLLGLGFIPLEFILLRLILAGSPLGPIPEIGRILILIISIIVPSIALYKKPADWASFLFLKLPLKGRSIKQHQINNLQLNIVPKLCFLSGVIFITCCFWLTDQSALLLAAISPFHSFSRIINLIFSIPILFLVVWQWHQLCYSIWLLTRSDEVLDKTEYLTSQQILKNQLCLGIDASILRKLDFSSSISTISVKINENAKNN